MELLYDTLLLELRRLADQEYDSDKEEFKIVTKRYVVEAKGPASAVLNLFRNYPPRTEDFLSLVDRIIADEFTRKSSGRERIVRDNLDSIVDMCIDHLLSRVEDYHEFPEMDLEILCR